MNIPELTPNVPINGFTDVCGVKCGEFMYIHVCFVFQFCLYTTTVLCNVYYRGREAGGDILHP